MTEADRIRRLARALVSGELCVHCGLPEQEHFEAGGCPASPEAYDWCQDPDCSAVGDLCP